MRSIIIDPHTATIKEVELKSSDIEQLQRAVSGDEEGCYVQAIRLGKGVDMFIDEEGLLKIPSDPEGITQSFFVLLSGRLEPRHIIAGRGVVASNNGSGDTIALNQNIKAETLKPFVKFVPQHNAEKAAELCKQVLELSGFVESVDALEGVQAKYNKLMVEALELTKNV